MNGEKDLHSQYTRSQLWHMRPGRGDRRESDRTWVARKIEMQQGNGGSQRMEGRAPKTEEVRREGEKVR